jgi:hypothetical protein
VGLTLYLGISFPVCGQEPTEEANSQAQPYQANFAGGKFLRLHLHDGDFKIVGSETNNIRITATGKNLSEAHKIKFDFSRIGDTVNLRLSHVPKNELQVTIAIPRNSNLFARMRGGELSVEGVAGNKDLKLTGGDLSVQVGNPEDYGRVNLSVRFGDVSGSQFGDPKGWIGNSVKHDGAGKHELLAHVFAGDLILKP